MLLFKPLGDAKSFLFLCLQYVQCMRILYAMKRPINLSLDQHIIDKARVAAAADGVSMSAWVSSLVAAKTRQLASSAPVALPPPSQEEKPADNTKEPPIGRNAPCPCGSGKKFKKCCGRLMA